MNGFGDEWRAGGGRVALGAMAGVAFGLSSLPFYTLGVFAKPLAAEFGWTRAAVQTAFAFQMAGSFLAAGTAGRLVDRYGVRRIGLLGLAAFATGMIALSLNPGSLTLWYATWFATALVAVASTPVVWTRGIADRFVAGRGTALGLALAGSGVGALVAPPAVTALIAHYGWRGAYVALASAVVAIAMPIVWRCFPPGRAVTVAAAGEGLTLRQALAGYRYWLLTFAIIAIALSLAGLIPSLVPLLTDKGLTPAAAAGYASVVGLAVIAGRLIVGVLVDRIWAPAVAAVALALPAASCWVLLQSGVDPLLTGIAAALAGLAAGAEVDLIAYLCMRYFGARHYGRIYGWQYGSFCLASGIAPMAFGRVFDLTGSYDGALRTAEVLLVAGALSLLALGRYPRRA